MTEQAWVHLYGDQIEIEGNSSQECITTEKVRGNSSSYPVKAESKSPDFGGKARKETLY